MAIKLTIISVDPDSDNTPMINEFQKREIIIGRGDSVDLNLNKSNVSSRHAVITQEDDDTLSIKDLGSSNGTMIEGRTVSPNTKYTLKGKERIFIGDFLIKPTIIEDKNSGDDDNEWKEASQIMQKGQAKKVEVNVTESKQELSSIFDDQDIVQIDVSKIDNDIFELDEDSTNSNNNPSENLFDNVAEKMPETLQEEIILDQKSIILRDSKDNDISTVLNDDAQDDSSLIISGTAGDNTFNLDLEAIKLLTLKGRCKRFGQGIADVIVAMNDKKVISDKNGIFEFLEIEENSHVKLIASKEGFIFEPKDFSSNLLQDTEVIFEGAKIFNIAGKIIYKNSGLKDVTIANNLNENIVTKDDGSFLITNIKEGTKYSLKPEKENFIFEIDDEEKTLEDNINLTIKATKLITISGYIKYKGTPVSDVIIDGGALGKTLTNDSGYYEFKNIKEGTAYTLKAHKTGFVFRQNS